MRPTEPRSRRGAAPFAAALWLLAPALFGARQTAPGQGPEPPAPAPAPEEAAAGDPQAEMLRLFHRIEVRLGEIDELLAEAAAGDPSRIREAEAAGIDELLRRTIESGRRNIEDIDRIIDLARQMGSQQSSGGGMGQRQGGQPSEGEGGRSPLDRGPQSTGREATPEGPGGEQPQGAQPGNEPGGERAEGEQPPDGGGRPRGDQAAGDPDPQNREGDGPSEGERGEAARTDPGVDRWGELPVHVRDVFRTRDTGDLPPRYRDWIDAYYRRLNRSSGGRRR